MVWLKMKFFTKGFRLEDDRQSIDSNMAAEENHREPRKRRDRRESGSHERKERRAVSEERTRSETPPVAALHDYNRLEVERRAERLSRARRPQYGGKRRRPAARVTRTPKENECFANDEDTVRCSSPPQLEIHLLYKQHYRADNIDLGSLHRQLCGEEPRPSVAAQRAPPPAPSCNRPPSPRPDTDNRLDKIKKKISVLKKTIETHESEFEIENGRPITQSDRIIDINLIRMYEALRRLQTEKRCLKADPAEYAIKIQAAKLQKERDDKLDLALKSDRPMADLVAEIDEWLEGCRQTSGRGTTLPENWSAGQLASEKACVQRALLRLEAARGRPPANSADRGAARHLYDRYRAVKRALASARPDMGNGELATIHEHETMLFNTSIDSSSEERTTDNTQQEYSSSPVYSPPEEECNEGLHCLSPDELDKLLQNAKLQKSVLRRTIKDYESNFETQNSRKLQRDDKKCLEEEYVKYKALKARIKLLNALLNKQKGTP